MKTTNSNEGRASNLTMGDRRRGGRNSARSQKRDERGRFDGKSRISRIFGA